MAGPPDPGSGKPRQPVSSRALWLAAAALVLIVSTAIAFTQAFRRDPYATPSVSDLAWWLSPIERNAFARLPVIVADLNQVSVAPGTQAMWVVGEGAMIARSLDGGRSWKRQTLAAGAAAPASPAAPSAPAPRSPAPRSGLVSVAEAQSRPVTRVPNIVGRSVAEAREILGKDNLRLELLDSKEPPGPRDVVTIQKPAAGTTISVGASVLVEVQRYQPPQVQQQQQQVQQQQQQQVQQQQQQEQRQQQQQVQEQEQQQKQQQIQQQEQQRQQATKPSQAPAPPPVKPPPPQPPARPALHAVQFVDAQRGWAVGDFGTIVSTLDGGDFWQRQESGVTAGLQALHVLADGQRAWAVGERGTIVATADGGKTWRPQPSPSGSALRSVTISADGQRGWIAGRDGTLLSTSNGGATWDRRAQVSAHLHGVFFDADGRRGWAVGDRGTILATQDGGVRWEPQTSNTDTSLASVHFVDGRRGWAVGVRGTILTTSDGGDLWALQDSGTRAALHAVHLDRTGPRGWIVGRRGTVLATDDGGRSWRARTSGGRAVLASIHGDAEGRRSWIAGGDGLVLTTSGRAWEVRPTGTRLGLAGIHMLPDGQRVWAVGEDGIVLSTTNGGARFERETTLPSGHLHDVRFTADGRSGWATSVQGLLLRGNGSAQWIGLPMPIALNGLALTPDGLRGWAAAGDGVIVPISSSGSTGARRSTGVSSDLMAVYITPDGSRGWAVGEDGMIVTTADGGLTWSRRPSGTEAVLLGTHSVDGLRGWAVGWNGTILATTDGGLQWTAQPSGTDVPLSGVHFAADGKRGWVTGWGVILATVDGGATWARVVHNALPAPWYYVSWLLALSLILPALRRPEPAPAGEPSVADVLVSDKPLEIGEPDALGFGQVARGLSRFLRNEQTTPPLTIAITGAWGSGKSSLMNLVRGDLRSRGFRPVWFNAWHHQKEEHLLAALLQTILAQAVPGWLTPEGFVFRVRLLWRRFGKRWRVVLPVIALLSGAAGFFFTDPARWRVAVAKTGAAGKQIGRILMPLLPDKVQASLTAFKDVLRETFGVGAAWEAILAAVAAIVLLVMVWRGITAFGVNPADLIGAMSGLFRRRALEAKVGFRHEFAQQFRDVTEALHPRTMVILIDDLDRCRPENVLEVLEAVNFLVSSGDCFVIIGMELDRVRRCVGLGFKDVAAELTDREEAQTAIEAPELAAEDDEGKRRRAVFAQQYLEKLINIEVPVPAPTESQAARVIAPEAEPDDGLGRWRAAGARVRRVSRVAAPVAGLFVAIVGGFGSAVLRWPAEAPPPLVADAPPPRAGGPASTAPTAPASKPPTPTPPSGERPSSPAVILDGVAGAPSPWIVTWPLAALLLAMGAVFLRRPPIVIKDSDEFTRALRIWHPLVFTRRSTPRSAKRFLNRVRFHAMRQRDLPEEERLRRLMAWMTGRRRSATVSPDAARSDDVIPERVLVALSAIEHSHPEWLADERLFKDPQGFLAAKRLPSTLLTALGDTNVGRELVRYRAPFAKLSAGVRT